jgi:hypothetical protein
VYEERIRDFTDWMHYTIIFAKKCRKVRSAVFSLYTSQILMFFGDDLTMVRQFRNYSGNVGRDFGPYFGERFWLSAR